MKYINCKKCGMQYYGDNDEPDVIDECGSCESNLKAREIQWKLAREQSRDNGAGGG